jgi:hypothetical protein
MDIFDIPVVPPGRERQRPDRRQDLPAGIVVFAFPAIYLAVLTVTELTKHPGLALLWFPAGISALGAAVCILTRMSVGRSIVAVIGCLWWCLVAGLTMVVIDILIFPF